MYAVMGSALTAGGLLAVALLALLFRNPDAPKWVHYELVAELAAVLVTAMLGAGLACLAMTPWQFMTEGVALVDVAAIIGAVAALVIAWRVLKLRARLRAYSAATPPLAQVLTMPSLGVAPTRGPTPPRTPKPRSGRPGRKAA